MKIIRSLALVICCLGTFVAFAEQSNTKIKSFRNLNIVDVNNGIILKKSFLVLKDDKIDFVGQSLPENYSQLEMIDG